MNQAKVIVLDSAAFDLSKKLLLAANDQTCMHIVLFYNGACSVCHEYLHGDFPVIAATLRPYADVYKMEVNPKVQRDLDVLATFAATKSLEGVVPQVAIFSRHGKHVATGAGPVAPLILLKKVRDACSSAQAKE